MLGWRGRCPGSALLLAALIVLSASLSVPLAEAADASEVFWLDPTQSSWLQISAGDDAATIAVKDPTSGACNKLSWPTLITNRVSVLEFPKEITKTATPLTANIRMLTEGTAFEVPAGEVASWRIRIQVVNLHSASITDVTVSDNFGAEYAVSDLSPSQGNVTTSTTGEAEKVHLLWSVGTLSTGGTATLELTASTKLNPAGRQEYTSPGLYQLNSGAVLKYLLGGMQHDTVSNVITVTAVGSPGSESSLSAGTLQTPTLVSPSLSNTPALVIGGLGASGESGESAQRSGIQQLPISFVEEFVPLSPTITVKPAHDSYPAGFEVPSDLRLEWRVVLTVKNDLPETITDITVTEHLGAELDVDHDSVSASPGLVGQVPPGAPYSTLSIVRQGNEKVTWTVNRLAPGQEASLNFIIYTREVNDHQLYSDCTEPCDPNYLNSGATLKYYVGHRKYSRGLPEIPVWVKCGGFMRVSLSTTRYDWQIRKPGTFTANPIEIEVYSNRYVTLTCSGFDDLVALPPETGRIPTFYQFSDAHPGASLSDWIRAGDLNSIHKSTTSVDIGSVVVWTLWPRLNIGSMIRAGSYEDTAVLTFTMLELCPHVCNQPLSSMTLWKEVQPGSAGS